MPIKMSKEIAEEYASSLSDLTVNSKPLINMLTILAEENIEHAGVIVETVEKHLEKVHPDIKLPVLYLVDSIIKNVGGAYTQKFSQSIVNMFTKTFKQVDEKTRSQMFKLRETWHDVFPSTKMYQLDVKVNLLDPAWPIQAQPHQSNIHVNPNFLKKPAPATSTTPSLNEEEEQMRSILVKKEQELLMLQRKKVEMELEQTRRQLQMVEKTSKVPVSTTTVAVPPSVSAPVAKVSPVPALCVPNPVPDHVPVKQRLGPPVNKVAGASRIAPVCGPLATARRDPRLARRLPPAAVAPPVSQSVSLAPPRPQETPVVPPIASNVFDIKPLERGVIKRKNVITIDVAQEARDPRQNRDRSRMRKRAEERRAEKHLERQKQKEQKVDKERTKLDNESESRDKNLVDDYMDRLQIADPKRINKLPPIPKKVRNDREVPQVKRKKETDSDKKKKRDKDSSGSSPEKRIKIKEKKVKIKESVEVDDKPVELDIIPFKELKNYHKERYMRRNKEKSTSPEVVVVEAPKPGDDCKNVAEAASETKDVDLRVLHSVIPGGAANVSTKRPSTETLEGKAKKHKFDILFGNEDVDLRQLPQVEENIPPPVTNSPQLDDKEQENSNGNTSEQIESPKKDWNDIKDREDKDDYKKTPTKLDLVRAKLAEATKGKDRLGRPLLFSKSPSVEKERRRTLTAEDKEPKSDSADEFDANDHKKTISIIMTQAKEQYNDGELDKNQYNTLMYQVLQLNEKLKLKEAKQRESLEISKRKLHAHIQEENHKTPTPKASPVETNNFGDIDERTLITPKFVDQPNDNANNRQDSDMRGKHHMNAMEPPNQGLLPIPSMMPMPPFMGPYPPIWRGPPRPTGDDFGPHRYRVPPMPPFFRGKFDKRMPRLPFDPRMPMPPLPTPKPGMCQGESPLKPYERSFTPPPLGAPGYDLPPTDFTIIEYIDQDPVKTIQIDGIPREIRFYDGTAIIMLDWDDPREIKFLPGCRRVTFDNKDSVVLNFNEGYKQVEIDDQVFNVRFGAPTRELFINGRWYECFFGGQPVGVIIDGKPRLVHLEGPLPQVDIGKLKRTDLVAGKINLIINATTICPVYLDAKVQKFQVNGHFFTIRFVDCLRTVLINEQPFRVEFGDLPKPIFLGNEKYFIRFSALPNNIRPGKIEIKNMEGLAVPAPPVEPLPPCHDIKASTPMDISEDQSLNRPVKTPSPEGVSQGLNMLASLMPTSMAPASSSEYSSADPVPSSQQTIPGLDTPVEEKPVNSIPFLGSINVNDLFAKLVATGIVPMLKEVKTNPVVESKVEEVKPKPKEDKNVIRRVDLLKTETLRVKQPGVVAKLYGGMQCSGCGARFPPEHTVRYSQHLDWHFRQNRRERDSARRAHSRHWHYDLPDWLQYEEIEDLEEREKNWFETGEGGVAPPGEDSEPGSPSAPAPAAQHHCALCGDRFQQFYNEDHDEWHLRNSVRHGDTYYHPICYEDFKAKEAREEPPKEESLVSIDEAEKTVDAIEIKDADDAEESDTESVVEVIEPESQTVPETFEIDDPEEDEDEDDVVLKADPVVQVDVGDADTDDETVNERAERDRLAGIDLGNVRIKQEPMDPDDEPIITAEEEILIPIIDSGHKAVTSSIDGNVQLDSTPPTTLPVGGIRINISKALPSLPTVANNQADDVSADEEPLPPGEEEEMEYKLKPSMEGVQFSRQPPVQVGSELSGLCTIM